MYTGDTPLLGAGIIQTCTKCSCLNNHTRCIKYNTCRYHMPQANTPLRGAGIIQLRALSTAARTEHNMHKVQQIGIIQLLAHVTYSSNPCTRSSGGLQTEAPCALAASPQKLHVFLEGAARHRGKLAGYGPKRRVRPTSAPQASEYTDTWSRYHTIACTKYSC